MRRAYLLACLTLTLVLLTACGGAGPAASATPDQAALQTRVASGVSATLTAMPAPTQPPPTATPLPPPPTATPVPPPPTATPSPPSVALPATYVVEQEYLVGRYTVQLWRDSDSDSMFFENIATISVEGQTLVQIENAMALGELTGTDVTGEGHPDAIIETYTGGAHCCSSTFLYDLGPSPVKLLETPLSNCGGRFEDLDGDEVFEFVTCDDLFAYVYCAYAASPAVRVILQYEPGVGYVPASPRFAHLYAEDIATHTRMAEEARPDEWAGWDDTLKCAVLPLVLDYLYVGQADQAWAALNRLYNYPDLALFWAEVVAAVSESSLYSPAGGLPAVPLPSYYMPQLLTSCGPDWQFVGLLSEGQAACDPAVPHRDIYWLGAQLRQIGLLGEGEDLQLTPAGCTTACRLDVVRLSDSARLGSIRLDTTVGFPGAVYRVNGVESARWRLRGDLLWEQVVGQ